MDREFIKLQVFFEDPFWVGVFERSDSSGRFSACKVTFGAEPKDYDLQEFITKNYYKLKFSPFIASENILICRVNPKRLQRDVKRQIENVGIGTKSQLALKLQQEQSKTERKTKSRQQREAELQRLYDLKQQKRKEKHKGR